MQLTISELAELFGRHRATVHRHIEAGRLSCTFRGDGRRVVDLSEAMRVCGEPDALPGQLQQDATLEDGDLQHAMLHTLQAMLEELVALRQEVAELKEQQKLPPAPADRPTKNEEDPHGLRALPPCDARQRSCRTA
jgi:hypothetical protein